MRTDTHSGAEADSLEPPWRQSSFPQKHDFSTPPDPAQSRICQAMGAKLKPRHMAGAWSH